MKLKYLSEDNVALLCSYIKKTFTQAAEFIDDENSTTTTTYSSIKIEALKTQLEEYSNNLINNLDRLEMKIVDEQPTLDNSDKNIIYLYKIDVDNNIYEQYIKIDDETLVDLGSTSIDLTDYVKTTQMASGTQDGLMSKDDYTKLSNIIVTKLVTNSVLDTKLADYALANHTHNEYAISNDVDTKLADYTKTSVLTTELGNKLDKAIYNKAVGITDITGIADGTITGAISELSENMQSFATNAEIDAMFK